MSLFTSSSFLLVFHVIPLLAVLLLFFTHPNVLRSSTSSSSSWTVTWNFPSSSSISRAFYSWVEVQPANGLSNETIDIVASHHEVTKLDGEEESTEDRNISSSSTTGRASVANKTVLTRLQKIERSLLKARSSIREAAAAAGDNYQQLIIRNSSSISSSKGTTLLIDADDDPDYIPRGPIYRNSKAFHRSYLEMEKLLKIYVYEEGELPIFHNGPCKSIYSSEGTFIHEMEMNQVFRTTDPNEALLYFLPFSVSMMVSYLYDAADRQNLNGIKVSVTDYINLIANKYPFWNRSLGADHFMLSCHDWGPRTSSFVPNLYHKSIRVLCNANTSEGFNPSKDASLPEINILTGETPSIGGSSPSTRTVLGFFAGHLHGYIRYLLLQQWKNKDRDLQVYEELPRGLSYQTMMKKSKFCLCPSGYEVASPRIVEAIYAECVPVLISDGYVPPFSDVLKWKSFSVMVKVKDIPNIKNILMGISQRQYLRLHRRLKQVQRHFVVNSPPKRYDVFHMILHSVWLRRLNIRIDDLDP
ncbi:hypothetical protein FEM48_Zijuj04G0200600 [Ziziphus jujuba var. spinosa]|uniref:Exostosin GT47 domain-containing protein n=1 Tax=Ziziphus jujuba var. spinosa TaxID=714518 RepID=A0A978VLX3_ZIZJJ|nr:hypothetical protein FEM48_Zijuj04G0200600 [Ziziphus jujuba var. spinosa]